MRLEFIEPSSGKLLRSKTAVVELLPELTFNPNIAKLKGLEAGAVVELLPELTFNPSITSRG